MTSYVLSKGLRARCPRCRGRMLAGQRVRTVRDGALVTYEHAGPCPSPNPSPAGRWPSVSKEEEG